MYINLCLCSDSYQCYYKPLSQSVFWLSLTRIFLKVAAPFTSSIQLFVILGMFSTQALLFLYLFF